MSLTDAAFSAYRAKHAPPRPPAPEKIRDPSECDPMAPGDGLVVWSDGVVRGEKSDPPQVSTEQRASQRLWVVRIDDVVTAKEQCPFGEARSAGCVKHSNLTGGADAFSGGEMIVLDDGAIIINGCSGRYTPRSTAEMNDVAKAFKESGYSVWSMGYDEESNFPLPFGVTTPIWIV